MRIFLVIIGSILASTPSYAGLEKYTSAKDINLSARTYTSYGQSDAYSRIDDPRISDCESGLSVASQQAYLIAKSNALNSCSADNTFDGLCKVKYLNYRIISVGDNYKCFATVGLLKIEDPEMFFTGSPH